MSVEFPTVPQHTSEVEVGQSLWQDARHRLRQNKMAVAGAIFVLLLALASFLAPLIAPHSYEQTNLAIGATPPSFVFWFGFVVLGCVLFLCLFFGGWFLFSVGFVFFFF